MAAAVITEVVGGVIGGTSIIAAAVGSRWFIHRSRPPGQPTGPICSCTHGYGVHKKNGSCQGQICRPHYTSRGKRSGREYVRCPCLRYDGPEPLFELWLPPTNSA